MQKDLVTFSDSSLTEVEVYGLSSDFNLSDGHSYLDAKKHYQHSLFRLDQIWELAANTKIPEMESYFKAIFAKFYGLNGLHLTNEFSICPTASNSIDIVGAWARSAKRRIGLIEPTFDNLALLLRRREVHLHAIPEICFYDIAQLKRHIQGFDLDCIFLVSPNNPTGGVIDRDQFSAIVRLCKTLNVVIILDASFRFCRVKSFDEYQIMRELGVSYIVIEDTGKCWPTLDAKASILAYSFDIAREIRTIYEELYLCTSNLTLSLISHFVLEAQAKGGIEFVQSLTERRLKFVLEHVHSPLVSFQPSNGASIMSVLWVNIKRTNMTDLEFVKYLSQFGLSVLPGRYFFWNSHEMNGHEFVRIALLKEDQKFKRGISRLNEALRELKIYHQKRESAYA